MKYTTYYLRFSFQPEAEFKLLQVGYKYESKNRNYYKIQDQVGDIDIIGEIYNNDGVYDEELFKVISPPTKKDGWHVNIICENELPEALQEYIVTPKNPHRVFA
jgi:hypothetical protein